MSNETTTVKDKAGNDVLINKCDEHLYAEFNKPKAKKKAPVKKAKQ